MRKQKEKEILTGVTVEKLAADGKSIAHIDGKVLFIPFAIPGDIVNVLVTRKKSGYMEGIIIKLLTPSKDRIEPFCAHYGDCGGCKWQALPYDLQLKLKEQQVVDQLTRIGKLKFPPILPIIGSEKTAFYRNKLEFTFTDRRWLLPGEDPEKAFSPITMLDKADYPDGFPRSLPKGYSNVNSRPEGYGLGFHISGYFDKVLDIDYCYLQREPSNEIRKWIKSYAIENNLSFFNLREQVGLLRNIVVRSNSKGDFMVILSATSLGGNPSPIIKLLTELSENFPQIKSLHYVINSKKNDTISDLDVIHFKGDDAIYEEMEGNKFRIGPKSFYQTNSEQAYRLYSIVREFAALTGNELVYDLYTGTGTIAMFLANNAKQVIGIEYVPEAVEDANINAKNNNISNCSFFAGDMKEILTPSFIADHGGSPDVIILDPPRAGIHPDVAKVILEANPSKIVYVSCNPATQARDLAILAAGYEITAVRPIDMFPHTDHIENVVALVRKVQ